MARKSTSKRATLRRRQRRIAEQGIKAFEVEGMKLAAGEHQSIADYNAAMPLGYIAQMIVLNFLKPSGHPQEGEFMAHFIDELRRRRKTEGEEAVHQALMDAYEGFTGQPPPPDWSLPSIHQSAGVAH